MYDWGNKFHGEKFGDYEVFHTDDDDQGEIVRIVKSKELAKEGTCGYNVDVKSNKKLTTPGGLKESVINILKENPNYTVDEIYEKLYES